MDIVLKFTVASEQGIRDLSSLKEAAYRQLYKSIVPADQLEQFISGQINQANITNELNAFGNQVIILYVKNEPVGVAIVKQGGTYPEVLKGKRVLYYSLFYIHPAHDNEATRASLWQKCLSISTMAEAVWMEVLQHDPLLPFLESSGLVIQEETKMKPFDQPSFILIRYK